ncbi:recombinase RecT [Novosphingobium sp. RL4]|uniref:recombinase RecT n=1 Tax=Novosphingobium sp. RL4 TaxID=3109595 RepID=UPI002D79D161|nr:recombinase RecT [Novosphingobium sp. RL4]WRT91877.1 recombinase RecT [Novosphingobium sp. RL4]
MASQANNPVAVIRQNLEVMAPQFKAALPAHVTVEKFSRVAMTAIQNNPQLQNADRSSLFGAVVRLAQDGLLPDGREAALVMFGNKAQAMPMIAGILKKIRQSGDVSYVSAQIVYENDRFKWSLGFDETIEHEPAPLDQEPGEPIAAYAVAVLKDGSRLLEVMRKSEIEKVRAVSRAARNGPWVQWWGEMARKTVMRRLSKRLPMSTDLEDTVFQRDETMAPEPQPRIVDVQAEPETPVSRLEALEHQIDDDSSMEEGNDSQMGEDGPAWESHVAALRSRLADASDAKSVEKVEKDWINNVRLGVDGEQAVQAFEAEIAARKREFAA